MAVCPSREAAEEYLRGDPFVQQGLVSRWRIRDWRDLFARAAPAGPRSAGRTTRAAIQPAGQASPVPETL
jgi:hypothetical protein